jgi:hypothetical protein
MNIVTVVVASSCAFPFSTVSKIGMQRSWISALLAPLRLLQDSEIVRGVCVCENYASFLEVQDISI